MNGTAEHKYKLKIDTICSQFCATRYTNEMEKVLIFLVLGLMMTISESFFITRRDLRRSWNLLPRWFNQPKQDKQDYGSEERDRADDFSSDHSHGRHSKRLHHHHKKHHHHCGHHDHDHYADDHYKSKYNDDHYKYKYSDDHHKTKYNDEHYKNRSDEDKRDDEDYYEEDKRNVQQKRKNEEQQPRRREKPRTRSTTTTGSPDYQETDQDQQQDDGSRSVQPQQQQQQQYRYANHPAMQYKKDYVAGVLVTIPNIRNGDDLEPYFQRVKYNNPFFDTFLKDGQEYAPEETIARPLYYNQDYNFE